MAWNRIQSASHVAGTATTVAATYTSNLTAGTKLIAVVSTRANSQTSQVQDGAANNFTEIAFLNHNNTASSGETSIWAMDTPAGDVGTAPTITATHANAPSAILILEVSGLATGNTVAAMVDGTAGTNSGSALGSTGSPSYTSSAANEFLVSAYGDNGIGPVTWTAPGALTADANSTNTSTNVALAYGNSTNGTEAGSWSLTGTAAPWSTILFAFKLAAAAAAPPALPAAQPGRTWARRFHHRQSLFYAAQAVTAAGEIPACPQHRPAGAPPRARLGARGALAAGILAAAVVSPAGRPVPAIPHPAPHRAVTRWVLAKTTLSPQPSSVPPPAWRQPFAPRPAHRATWRVIAAPAPAVVAVTAVPPARPAPVTNRPPPPHRATGKGILATATLSPQPSRVPPPLWRQPNAPRPPHRALWRAIAGPAPAVIGPAPAAPSRPAPVTNRPPAPHRAIVRRIVAAAAPLAPPSRPQPIINRPPAPHRAVTRWVLAKTTLSAQPSSVPAPHWQPQPRYRPAHRAVWGRGLAGPAPPPPPFTIGALTAATAATGALGAGDKPAGALSASTAPLGGITATDV